MTLVILINHNVGNDFFMSPTIMLLECYSSI